MLTITLPPEIERGLTEVAVQQGTTPEILALDSLREKFVPAQKPVEPAEGETLFDFLQGYMGTIHSGEHVPGGAQMSTGTGRKFAEGLAAKRRAGKL